MSGGFLLFCLLICLPLAISAALLILLWIRAEPTPPDSALQVFLRVRLGPSSYFEGFKLMRLTNEQRVVVTAIALTAAGNLAAIDGPVTFTSSDESVARVDVVDDTSAYVTAVGPGASQVLATFDADLGEGVRTIELSGAIEVVPAEAERGEIQFGEAELTPPDA